MKPENMSKEILLKIFELANKGINVKFEEDFGKGTVTIYCGKNHTHCGFPNATEDELIESKTLVLGNGFSFQIYLNESDVDVKEKINIVKAITECINNLIKSKIIKSFRPSIIMKNIKGSTEEMVINILDNYVIQGILKKEYEICCSNCFSILCLSSEEKLEKNKKNINYCWHCNKDIEPEDTYVNVLYKKCEK